MLVAFLVAVDYDLPFVIGQLLPVNNGYMLDTVRREIHDIMNPSTVYTIVFLYEYLVKCLARKSAIFWAKLSS